MRAPSIKIANLVRTLIQLTCKRSNAYLTVDCFPLEFHVLMELFISKKKIKKIMVQSGNFQKSKLCHFRNY